MIPVSVPAAFIRSVVPGCCGKVPLAEAQREIATNWIAPIGRTSAHLRARARRTRFRSGPNAHEQRTHADSRKCCQWRTRRRDQGLGAHAEYQSCGGADDEQWREQAAR